METCLRDHEQCNRIHRCSIACDAVAIHGVGTPKFEGAGAPNITHDGEEERGSPVPKRTGASVAENVGTSGRSRTG